MASVPDLVPVFHVVGFYVCMQSTGPFLHLGAVAAMTALGWIVAGQVVRGERTSECANAVDCANEHCYDAHIHSCCA